MICFAVRFRFGMAIALTGCSGGADNAANIRASVSPPPTALLQHPDTSTSHKKLLSEYEDRLTTAEISISYRRLDILRVADKLRGDLMGLCRKRTV